MALQMTDDRGAPPFDKTIRMANLYKVIRVAVGAFLLASAGLKAHGLATDPLAQDSLLVTPRVLITTIELEVILGLWLLSGWAARASRTAALTFFALLAVASLYLALDGQPSCGCFGRVAVSPWWTLALDVGVIAALISCRPLPGSGFLPASIRHVLAIGLGAVAFLTLGGGAFMLASADPTAVLARLRGEPIAVQPSMSEVGSGVAEEQRSITFQLTNRSDHPVQFVGGTSNCACIATADLPVTVAPRESRPITVKVNFKGEVGRFQRTFGFYTDDENQPVVVARFAGRVVAPDSP